MKKIKMNSKGTITLPVEIRKALKLKSDMYFCPYVDDGAIILVPLYDLTTHNPFIRNEIYPKENFEIEYIQDLEAEKRV